MLHYCKILMVNKMYNHSKLSKQSYTLEVEMGTSHLHLMILNVSQSYKTSCSGFSGDVNSPYLSTPCILNDDGPTHSSTGRNWKSFTLSSCTV